MKTKQNFSLRSINRLYVSGTRSLYCLFGYCRKRLRGNESRLGNTILFNQKIRNFQNSQEDNIDFGVEELRKKQSTGSRQLVVGQFQLLHLTCEFPFVLRKFKTKLFSLVLGTTVLKHQIIPVTLIHCITYVHTVLCLDMTHVSLCLQDSLYTISNEFLRTPSSLLEIIPFPTSNPFMIMQFDPSCRFSYLLSQSYIFLVFQFYIGLPQFIPV